MKGDIYFNPGSRLRISSDLGNDGPFVLWVRWGWRAQWQFSIVKRLLRPRLYFSGARVEFGPLTFTHYR